MATANTINQLIALSIPEIQKIFLEVMQDLVSQAMLDEMVIAIEAQDAEALYRASGFTPAVLGAILDAVEEVFERSASITVQEWPKRIMTPAGPAVFRFNMRNPATEQQLKEFSSQWITRISDEVRENIRTVMQQGVVNGDNPRRIALDIVGRVNPSTKKREGGVVGLASNQVQWVNSARRYLEQNDPRYFDLTLRDKRFDGIVKSAIDANKPLDQETVSKLLTAYKTSALRYRGENIARTEAIQAVNRGEYAAHAQAISEGILDRRQITKEWDDVGDGRVRTTHRILAEKYGKGQGIGFEDSFVSPSGARFMYPGDQSLGAPAAEVIMCRCKQRIRVNWAFNEDGEDA
jgi:hypothetical protein